MSFLPRLLCVLLVFISLPFSNVMAIGGGDDLTTDDFSIDVRDFTPGNNDLVQDSAQETIDATISTVIKSLMIVFGAIALLVMSIGAGYMIIYHGNDELLSRGKTIFKAGILGLVIALSSYYIVDFVRYLLYTN